MSNTNQPHITSRYESWLEGRADAKIKEALREFTLALQSGSIDLSLTAPTPPVYAGGVNYCPNSDFKFSKKAIEVIGTLPADATKANHECYRFYRQERNANLVLDAARALKASTHSLYAANEGVNTKIPIWDRVNGWLTWGASAEPLWDVAVRLYNNDIKPSDTWHVRFVLGALTADLVPDDLEMYCGFWHKTAASESWIEGGGFTLGYEVIGIKGTKAVKYMVVAVTDGGVTLHSGVLNVTDAPNVLNETNFVRVSYGAAAGSGFIEFRIYRQDVASDAFHQIGLVRNDNNLLFDDDGDSLMPVNGFPSGGPIKSQALAYSRRLDVGEFGGSLLINDFTIKIPDDYNWSQTLAQSQFFRFGFTTETAANRQIRLDRIYCGPSFNQWSDSPFDATGAIPSTSQSGGTPSAGGSGTPPLPGSGNCIRIDVPVLRLDFDERPNWLPYKDIPIGDMLENGRPEKNVVREKQMGETPDYYRVQFSNKSWIYCNRLHRLRLDAEGRSEAVMRLGVGETVWGWTAGVEGPVSIISKMRIRSRRKESFGTFALVGERSGGDHFYIAGFSNDRNSGVFNKNRKAEIPLIE